MVPLVEAKATEPPPKNQVVWLPPGQVIPVSVTPAGELQLQNVVELALMVGVGTGSCNNSLHASYIGLVVGNSWISSTY
jgi:hypothetical protein